MILEVKNASFSYSNKKEILKNLNLKVDKGEILSILGPNGVGKTTLLKCMMGLLPWKEGMTTIDKVNIKDMRDRELWSKISYIPQAHYFSFSYTGLEMVLLGLGASIGVFSQPSRQDIEKAKEIMENIGIGHLISRDCNKLSGGEMQMVLIARALISDPELIILDEPETGLDFHNQLLVLNLIKSLVREKSISAILNTHYPSNALSISDNSLILSKAGPPIYGKTDQVINTKNIEDIFKVKVCISDQEYKGRVYKTILPVELA